MWDKIRRDERLQEGRKENTVEMEDEEGNVMSAKVYNEYVYFPRLFIFLLTFSSLKKQGLL